MLCSICIPVYNEEECLPVFLSHLLDAVERIEKLRQINFEIIAVDDGSTDESLEILKYFSGQNEKIKVFAFEQNSGHQAAILCGLKHAAGDLIITMDSDGQDPPESISDLINEYIVSSHEIILAKRISRNDSLAKRATAWIFYRSLTLAGLPLESRDAGDFRLITKRVKDLILDQPNSLQYIRGQIFTLKTPAKLIRIDRKKRIAGRTKYTLSKMTRLAISSAFVIDPFKVAQIYIVIALLFTVLSGLTVVVFIGVKLVIPTYYASGITTLAIMLLILFSILISMIAFQSLYISLLFRSLRNEPAYLEKRLQ